MAQPIFILSSPRSGSTLLRYVLDTHPEIYAPPELSLGPLSHSLATAFAGLNGTRRTDSPEILGLVAGHVRRLMDEYTARRGKSIWCEKSPQNVEHLDLLTSLFPDARYLCLYRNHLDTVASCLESSRFVVLPPLVEYFGRNPRRLLRATVDFWIDTTTQLLDLERSGRVPAYRVRYEDLVRQPDKVLAPLFAFLGLAWDAALVDAIYRTHHDHGAGDFAASLDQKIRTDSIGRGRTLPLELATQAQHARLDELNRELGYDEIILQLLAAAPVPAGSSAGARRDSAGDPRGARWVFEERLAARLRERHDELAHLTGSYRFEIAGDGGGTWVLQRHGSGALQVLADGRTAGAGAAVLGIQAPDLLAIVDGRLHVVRLLQEGRITSGGAPLGRDEVQALIALFRADA